MPVLIESYLRSAISLTRQRSNTLQLSGCDLKIMTDSIWAWADLKKAATGYGCITHLRPRLMQNGKITFTFDTGVAADFGNAFIV